jgi:hypothetical protein
MRFVAEGPGRAARIARVSCGRKTERFGALPYTFAAASTALVSSGMPGPIEELM